jgi:hypothetical protein
MGADRFADSTKLGHPSRAVPKKKYKLWVKVVKL